MGSLKKYREVGMFDVLNAPLNPIGAFNAEQFKADALELMGSGSRNLVVDLGALDFLYSDAFNAFLMIHAKLVESKGFLGILTGDPIVVKTLQNSGVDRVVQIFSDESEVMALSLERMAEQSPRPAPLTAAVPEEDDLATLLKEPAVSPSSTASATTPIAPSVSTAVPPAAASPTTNAPDPYASPRGHKFTQSFNSASLEDLDFEDLDQVLPRHSALSEESKGISGGVWIFIIAFLVMAAFAAWYFLPR